MPDNGSEILKAIKSLDVKVGDVDSTVREIQVEQAVISTTLTLNEKNLNDKLKAVKKECKAISKESATDAIGTHIEDKHNIKTKLWITGAIIGIIGGILAIIAAL